MFKAFSLSSIIIIFTINDAKYKEPQNKFKFYRNNREWGYFKKYQILKSKIHIYKVCKKSIKKIIFCIIAICNCKLCKMKNWKKTNTEIEEALNYFVVKIRPC